MGSGSAERNVVEILRDFCQRLNDRLDRFAKPVNASVFTGDIGRPRMIHIFDEDVRLDKEMLGQKPHRFMEEYLVNPVFEPLGYEFIPEPRCDMIGKKDICPDFGLIPIERQRSALIIGEIKSPGEIKRAVKQLKEKYLIELSSGAIGIATDGIQWKLFQRSESGIDHIRPYNISLRKTLHEIRQPLIHDRMKPKDVDDLSANVDSFVQSFRYPMYES